MLTWPFHRCRDPEPEACAASALYTELSPILGEKGYVGREAPRRGMPPCVGDRLSDGWGNRCLVSGSVVTVPSEWNRAPSQGRSCGA